MVTYFSFHYKYCSDSKNFYVSEEFSLLLQWVLIKKIQYLSQSTDCDAIAAVSTKMLGLMVADWCRKSQISLRPHRPSLKSGIKSR